MTMINLADFGFKSLETTGSIAAGSNQLRVASAVGFKVGDSVIIGVGGEAGEGLRGTTGVGGVWDPSTSPFYNSNAYYFGAVAPKALVARVTGVGADGTLTLDKAASASTTNAYVYYDNKPAWDAAVASTTAAGVTLDIPAGDFAVSGTLKLAARNGWTVEGAGKDATKLFAVDGGNAAMISIFQSNNTVVKDFELDGNARLQGYGFAPPAEGWQPGGIVFTLCYGGTAQDITVRDVWNMAVGSQQSTNVWAYRVDAHLTDGLAQYTQWQFQWSDSTGGGAVDSSVESPVLAAGFNSFRSTGTSFIRPTLVNASMAANTSGNFLYEDVKITITANSYVDDNWFSKLNPLINVNSNLDATNPLIMQGGKIINAQIVQEGYINSAHDILAGIMIGYKNPNVTVSGGSYIAPDYVSGNTGSGPVGIWSHGANTVIDGFGVVGKGVVPNIIVDTGGVANSFANSIWVKSGQAINNGIPQAVNVAPVGTGTSADGHGTYTYLITRSGDLSHALNLAYSVLGSGDHPADAADFVGGTLPAGSLTFAPGETSKTVTVTTGSAFVRGADEEFTFALSTSTPGAYIVADEAPGTIGGGDAAPIGQPILSGVGKVGEPLIVDASSIADADGLGPLHYIWQTSHHGGNWTTVGADSASYSASVGDAGALLRAIVAYVDGKGLLESLVTAPVAIGTDDAAPTGRPVLSGTSKAGHTLTVDASNIADADGMGAFHYVWQKSNQGSWITIGGDNAAYSTSNADAGASVRAVVTYVDGKGFTETLVADAITVAPAHSSARQLASAETHSSVTSVTTDFLIHGAEVPPQHVTDWHI
jgi:hypothetical protein